MKFQAYSQRYGHDINGIRPVMIPDEHGEWVSRHEAEHMAERLKLAQSRIAELEAKLQTADKLQDRDQCSSCTDGARGGCGTCSFLKK